MHDAADAMRESAAGLVRIAAAAAGMTGEPGMAAKAARVATAAEYLLAKVDEVAAELDARRDADRQAARARFRVIQGGRS
jgi:hypothetical protein